MGLRGKLALSVAGVAALVATLIGLLVYQQTARTQLDSARAELDARLLEAVEDYEMMMDGGVLVDPSDLPRPLRDAVRDDPVRATYLDRSGSEPVLWAALLERPEEAAAAPGAADGTQSTEDEAEPQRVLAVRTSYQPQTDALAALNRTLLGAGMVASALGSVLGLLLAVVGGRRLAGSVRAARQIAAGDLAARVQPRGRDEIATMGAAVNTMADALGARLEAERRITADIAHELRTPVAGLVTAAELLPPGRPTELVQDRARTLRRLVEDVLEVSRLDTEGAERAEPEECHTSTLARQAAAACAEQFGSHTVPAPRRPAAVPGAPASAGPGTVIPLPAGDGTGIPLPAGGGPADPPDIQVTVRADARVHTDPRRVARILGNLLSNAVRHGAGPVQLEVDGPVLRIRDHGPGFPAELLRDGPQRFRTGARERGTGTGLGLTIVTGQARVLGATVHWANAPDGGAETTLTLPH